MAKLTIESAEKRVVTVEVTIVYDDGTSETRREKGEQITIEATNIATLSINGNVYGDVRAGADVSCGDVDGDAKAGTDISCETIHGDARAGADIHATDIDGNVRAGDDVQCNDISGNATAGADINCNYIAGSATAGGEIAAMGFEEDEEE